MKKTKEYYPVRFSADALRKSYEAFLAVVPDEAKAVLTSYLSVRAEDAQWNHDSDAEFFAEYRKGAKAAVFQKQSGLWSFRMQLIDGAVTLMEISCPTRDQVESVCEAQRRKLLSP